MVLDEADLACRQVRLLGGGGSHRWRSSWLVWKGLWIESWGVLWPGGLNCLASLLSKRRVRGKGGLAFCKLHE